MVFYRKYRPQTIDDLDSKEVRDKLNTVLSDGNAHALLFTGPKGLGKTSAARIVAKVLNCEKIKEKKDLEPCNKCDQCISISNGSNVDVLEIDGASNRGIDEIRDLREKIKLSAASAKKKVYIIDEVHMLTTEAFNALLKTLEEPPSHVIFILCTTEPHKVPSTILSRCFQIVFKKATDEELIRSFERIAKSEKIKADKDALLEVAKFADGSFRDGVKVFEELSLEAKGQNITKEFVQNLYQTSGISKNIDEMIESFVAKDIKKGINLIKQLNDNGSDFKFFADSLVSKLHEILLEKVDVRKSNSQFTDKIELSGLKSLIELLSEAAGKIKYAILPQLPLELALVEWSAMQSFGTSSHIVEDAHDESSGKLIQVPAVSNKQDSSNDILTQLIDNIKVNNQQIAGFLRGCEVKDYENGKLVLEAKFEFHKDKLDDPKSIMIIENTLKAISKKDTKVSFVLKS